MNEIEKKIYSIICSRDGIKAKEIAKLAGVSRTDINHMLYGIPFVHELCYQDADYNWHGLIRQAYPHTGLGDFCCYYGTVERFLEQPDDEWLEELKKGCKSIGRNLNDTRGLFHRILRSFQIELRSSLRVGFSSLV